MALDLSLWDQTLGRALNCLLVKLAGVVEYHCADVRMLNPLGIVHTHVCSLVIHDKYKNEVG